MNKGKIALILLLFALVVVIPVYAQEATEAPTEQVTSPESQPVAGAVAETPTQNQAPGLPAGILLIGLGAALAVGGLSLMRDRAQRPPST